MRRAEAYFPPFDFVESPVTERWPAIWDRGGKVRQTTSIVKGAGSPKEKVMSKVILSMPCFRKEHDRCHNKACACTCHID